MSLGEADIWLEEMQRDMAAYEAAHPGKTTYLRAMDHKDLRRLINLIEGLDMNLEQAEERERHLRDDNEHLQQELHRAEMRLYELERPKPCHETIPGRGFANVMVCKLPQGHEGPHWP